jgi:hypothetical protein
MFESKREPLTASLGYKFYLFMKAKLERLATGLLLAPVAPLLCFLLCWWAGYTFLPEKWIPYAAITGLIAGIWADVLFLKKLLDRRLSWPLWMAVYLFYSTGLFGFFMGVPVLHAALAIPAGFVVGSRLAEEKAELPRVRKVAQYTAWFTTAVLALVCAASATFALLSPSTADDLHGMLRLGFDVTQEMIVGLILVGGVLLLGFGWGLSVVSVRLTYLILKNTA